MKKKKGAFGQRKKTIKERPFVGRKTQIGTFADNLSNGPDSSDFINIFNVYGQSGVGKSTLIQQKFLPLAKSAGYAVAYIETDDPKLREIPALLNDIAEKLKKHGADFKEFNKFYKKYRQELGKLEADPERPQGTLGSLVTEGLRMGGKAGREFIPGGGIALSDGLIDSVSKIGGSWADFVARKITNKDEVDLILRPVEVLTPLWLQDFDKFTDDKNCALFLDTYEAADEKLDAFLCDLLNEKYGDIPLPSNLLLCIGGQKPLDKMRWENWEDITEKVPLKEFTEEEARAYLTQKGVTSEAAMQQILAISKRLPVYLTLLGEGNPDSDDDIYDPNEKVVEHFMRHIKDPLLRRLAERAALPRHFNLDILACLLTGELPEGQSVQRLFDWLKSRPFVKKQYGAWTYHPVVREMMQRYLRERSLTEWELVHRQAADFYRERCERLGLREEEKQFASEEWCKNRVEMNYHLLGENYTLNIGRVLEDWVLGARLSHSIIVKIIIVIIEVEEENSILNMWSSFFQINHIDDLLPFFQKINKNNILKKKENIVYSLLIEGELLPVEKIKTKIKFYQKAVEILPEKHEAWCNMGNAFGKQKRYEDAIAAYQKAVEILPENHDAWYNMGVAFYEQKRYEEAIAAFQKAVEILPENHDAWYNMGNAFYEQERYEDAIAAYQKAAIIQPQNSNYQNSMAWIYLLLHSYQKAIEHFTKSWKLSNEKYPFAPMNLGHTYLLQNDFATALEWYKKSIPLWENIDVFWQDMQSDYIDLNMQNNGITPEDYQSLITRLKEEFLEKE